MKMLFSIVPKLHTQYFELDAQKWTNNIQESSA